MSQKDAHCFWPHVDVQDQSTLWPIQMQRGWEMQSKYVPVCAKEKNACLWANQLVYSRVSALLDVKSEVVYGLCGTKIVENWQNILSYLTTRQPGNDSLWWTIRVDLKRHINVVCHKRLEYIFFREQELTCSIFQQYNQSEEEIGFYQ